MSETILLELMESNESVSVPVRPLVQRISSRSLFGRRRQINRKTGRIQLGGVFVAASSLHMTFSPYLLDKTNTGSVFHLTTVYKQYETTMHQT